MYLLFARSRRARSRRHLLLTSGARSGRRRSQAHELADSCHTCAQPPASTMIPKLRIMGKQTEHTPRRARRPLGLLVGAILAVLVLAPATAAANGPPVIEKTTLVSVSETGATVEAQIDPEGLETSYEIKLVWQDADPPGPGENVSDGPHAQTGQIAASPGEQTVSAVLTGMQRGYTYWYEVIATNANGKAKSGAHPFGYLNGGAYPEGVGSGPPDEAEIPQWLINESNSESAETLQKIRRTTGPGTAGKEEPRKLPATPPKRPNSSRPRNTRHRKPPPANAPNTKKKKPNTSVPRPRPQRRHPHSRPPRPAPRALPPRRHPPARPPPRHAVRQCPGRPGRQAPRLQRARGAVVSCEAGSAQWRQRQMMGRAIEYIAPQHPVAGAYGDHRPAAARCRDALHRAGRGRQRTPHQRRHRLGARQRNNHRGADRPRGPRHQLRNPPRMPKPRNLPAHQRHASSRRGTPRRASSRSATPSRTPPTSSPSPPATPTDRPPGAGASKRPSPPKRCPSKSRSRQAPPPKESRTKNPTRPLHCPGPTKAATKPHSAPSPNNAPKNTKNNRPRKPPNSTPPSSNTQKNRHSKPLPKPPRASAKKPNTPPASSPPSRATPARPPGAPSPTRTAASASSTSPPTATACSTSAPRAPRRGTRLAGGARVALTLGAKRASHR